MLTSENNQACYHNKSHFHTKPRMMKRSENHSSSSSDSSSNGFRIINKSSYIDHDFNDNNNYHHIYDQIYYNGYSNDYNTSSKNKASSTSGILNVFNENLEEGMRKLREFSKLSKYVAIDTEFPGTIIKISPERKRSVDMYYDNVKVNSDILKLIQIGFSFFDSNGVPINKSSSTSTIQFNFQFDKSQDTGNHDSLKLLHNCGIDFHRLSRSGIDPDHFAELFITTGLVMNDSLTWIGFHASHDWAYILKLITGWIEMPSRFADFQTLLAIYFPKTVDLKTIALKCKLPGCGLQDLSQMMQVAREGSQHQAGSDSKLTGETYFKLVSRYAPNGEPRLEWYDQIYGLNFCAHPWHTMGGSDDNSDNTPSPMSNRSSPYSGDVTPDEDTNSNEDSI